jgi:nitroreductase
MSKMIAEIETRRARRALSDKAVPEDVLARIMTAATYAPSCFNNQPWRFLVVSREKELETVKEHPLAGDKRFLFLTNSSERSPRELQQKLARMHIEVPVENFYTSALATAGFLASQHPHGSAYVIGEAGLTNALYQAGFSMNDVNPDYVVVGDTRTYSFERVERVTP